MSYTRETISWEDYFNPNSDYNRQKNSNSAFYGSNFTDPSSYINNLGSALDRMGSNYGTNDDYFAKIMGYYNDVWKTQQQNDIARQQMANQDKQFHDNLAWKKEELEKQLQQAREQGDLNRAHELEMQTKSITAQMDLLKYKMEQDSAESEKNRGWQTSERLGTQDYNAWTQQQQMQEQARQAELNRQYQENMAAQQYQRNRESQWQQAQYDANAQKNSIYANMAGMMTDEQKAAGLGELNKASSQYAQWLAQGGMYSPDEIKQIENAAYNDIANQTNANLQSYANSMASRGISSSPAAARIMQAQGLSAAAQGRGAARANVMQKQVESRSNAAQNYANLQNQIANLTAAATQGNALKAAGYIQAPGQYWDPNSTGTNQSWKNTGNNGYYTPNNNYSWR